MAANNITFRAVLAQRTRRERERNELLTHLSTPFSTRRELGQRQRREREKLGEVKQPRFFPGLPPTRRTRAGAEREAKRLKSIMLMRSIRQKAQEALPMPIPSTFHIHRL